MRYFYEINVVTILFFKTDKDTKRFTWHDSLFAGAALGRILMRIALGAKHKVIFSRKWFFHQ